MIALKATVYRTSDETPLVPAMIEAAENGKQSGFGRPEESRKLLVAPFNLRERVIEEIRRVGQASAAKKHARIRLKVNNLSDPAIIDELYLASQAGAKIDLIIRSICALRPGVKGLSENIRVRSVLGRFLEHSRVFHFEARGDRKYFVGSADLLPRNLDHRLEAVAPVQDARLQQRLSAALDALLEDETAWELQSDGIWERRSPKKGEQARSGQTSLMRSARRRRRARRAA